MAAYPVRMLFENLLRRARPHWRGWLLIIAVMLVSTGLTLLQPWPIQVLMDDVLGAGATTSAFRRTLAALPGGSTARGLLLWLVVAELLIFAAHSAADALGTIAWVRVGQRMVYEVAAEQYARIQRRSLLFHTRGSVGDCISRILGDSWSVYTTADKLLFAPGHALITGIAILIVMLRMDPMLALLSVAAAPCMTLSSYWLANRIRALTHARRAIESKLQSHVQQTLAGIPVMQAFGQEDREQGRFRELTRAAIRNERQGALAENLAKLGSGLVAALGAGLILWYGSHRVDAGILSAGSLMVFLNYLIVLQTRMGEHIDVYAGLQPSLAGMERVMEILSTELEIKEAPNAVKLPQVRGHLRFEEVTFGYEPGKPVLRGVNLELLPGQTVAVVGTTGAGKSTLAGLVLRLFDPWQGRITLDGHELRSLQVKDLRDHVALVLQEPFLFPATVAENIAYSRPEASREQIVAAAQAAQAGFVEHLEHGYDTLLGERAGTLSGGEQQRLAIARALLKDAPVLILDEPTSALDVQSEEKVLQALERLKQGRTTLVISHRLSTIRRADQIVVLDEGTVVEQGTHQELLAASGRYARIHGLQSAAAVAGASEPRTPLPEGDDVTI